MSYNNVACRFVNNSRAHSNSMGIAFNYPSIKADNNNKKCFAIREKISSAKKYCQLRGINCQKVRFFASRRITNATMCGSAEKLYTAVYYIVVF